jgi:hypothetical protein
MQRRVGGNEVKSAILCAKCGGKIWSMRYMVSSTKTSGGIRNRRYCPNCDIVWKILFEEEKETIPR